jgi:hypothetical protein
MALIPDQANASETRRHRDIFTPAEALAYLGVEGDAERTLKTLREEHGLICFRIGQRTMYHRAHLDNLVLRLAGIDQQMRSRRPAV